MGRKKMILVVSGTLAAAAIAGTAIGATASEVRPNGSGLTAASVSTAATDPTDASAGPTPTGAATGTPSADPSATPGTGPTGTPGGTPSSAPPAAGEVTSARAVEIALAAAGGGKLDEVEREQEHGRAVWDVEINKDGQEIEVDVDVVTGEVVKTERDDDKHDDDDDSRDGDDDDSDDSDDDDSDDDGKDHDDD